MANEKRLIWDVDMKTAFREWFDHEDFRTMNQVIDDIPTVDAVEVVHGKWEKSEYNGFVRCNQCKNMYIGKELFEGGKWNYCPNCGAKMDGGNEDG